MSVAILVSWLMRGARQYKEMNIRVGPTVKYIWNVCAGWAAAITQQLTIWADTAYHLG